MQGPHYAAAGPKTNFKKIKGSGGGGGVREQGGSLLKKSHTTIPCGWLSSFAGLPTECLENSCARTTLQRRLQQQKPRKGREGGLGMGGGGEGNRLEGSGFFVESLPHYEGCRSK